ncbi:MAG: PBP1A family penicillin-binding protein [Ruminococcaceae bacterium]|nr:PBP1A family penicillin-binding protein [Oscillospiraceae bacterium]
MMKTKKQNRHSTLFILKTVWKYLSKIITVSLSVFFTLFIIAVITGVIMASALAIYVKNYIDPTFDIPDLQSNIDLSTTLYYNDRSDPSGIPSWVEMEDEQLHASENRTWVSYDKIPENLINAFIAIEDKRFRTHNGIDYRRTIGAFLELAKGNTSYGGSTITQQLIKNNTGQDQTTIQRKIQEIMQALDLEKRRSKEEIMEMYLNTIYLSQGQYGVQAAADEYFGKDVIDLTLVECAAIASITQYPTKWDPRQNPDNNKERRSVVLDQMLDQDLITQEEYDEAYNAELVLVKKEEHKRNEKIRSYFIDQTITDVINDLMSEKGYSEEMAKHLVYAGGLKIYTTVDPNVQSILEEVYEEENEQFFQLNGNGMEPQSAMVIMDHTNGDIVAMVGGRGEKDLNLGLNRATQSKRQPGSAMKPIAVYAPAIDLGLLTYGSCIDDTPPLYVNNSPWPKNANNTYSGHVSLARAIAYSYNTTAIRSYLQLGDEYVFNNLRDKFHITTLVDEITLDSGKVLTDHTPSLALGGLTYGVTVREMAGAYSVFANRGIYSKPRTYIKVLDKDNNVLLSNEGKQQISVSSDTAAIMTRLLQNVVDYGTGASIDLKNRINVAGKTGSTTDNKDLYFCGYTPYYTAAIWVGYDIPRVLSNTKIATAAWNTVMKKIHEPIIEKSKADGTALKSFDENCSNLVQAQFCIDSGMKPGPNCALDPRGSRTSVGWFSRDNLPTRTCTAHVATRWDVTTGAVAGPGCPDDYCVNISLVRENGRSFNSKLSNVYITDAQYIWRDVPTGYVYPTVPSVPFFSNALPDGINAGFAAEARPKNSYCFEHNDPNIKIEDIIPDAPSDGYEDEVISPDDVLPDNGEGTIPDTGETPDIQPDATDDQVQTPVPDDTQPPSDVDTPEDLPAVPDSVEDPEATPPETTDTPAVDETPSEAQTSSEDSTKTPDVPFPDELPVIDNAQ